MSYHLPYPSKWHFTEGFDQPTKRRLYLPISNWADCPNCVRIFHLHGYHVRHLLSHIPPYLLPYILLYLGLAVESRLS